ncbi:hypothetical protein OAD26_00495 [bacterium]|nr:hypothetical protein [bacterium]
MEKSNSAFKHEVPQILLLPPSPTDETQKHDLPSADNITFDQLRKAYKRSLEIIDEKESELHESWDFIEFLELQNDSLKFDLLEAEARVNEYKPGSTTIFSRGGYSFNAVLGGSILRNGKIHKLYLSLLSDMRVTIEELYNEADECVRKYNADKAERRKIIIQAEIDRLNAVDDQIRKQEVLIEELNGLADIDIHFKLHDDKAMSADVEYQKIFNKIFPK